VNLQGVGEIAESSGWCILEKFDSFKCQKRLRGDNTAAPMDLKLSVENYTGMALSSRNDKYVLIRVSKEYANGLP